MLDTQESQITDPELALRTLLTSVMGGSLIASNETGAGATPVTHRQFIKFRDQGIQAGLIPSDHHMDWTLGYTTFDKLIALALKARTELKAA